MASCSLVHILFSVLEEVEIEKSVKTQKMEPKTDGKSRCKTNSVDQQINFNLKPMITIFLIKHLINPPSSLNSSFIFLLPLIHSVHSVYSITSTMRLSTFFIRWLSSPTDDSQSLQSVVRVQFTPAPIKGALWKYFVYHLHLICISVATRWRR